MRAIKSLTLGLLACLYADLPVLAGDDPAARELAEACARSVCRTESREVRLRMPDGGGIGFDTRLLPYADGGDVVLYPGDSVKFRFVVRGAAPLTGPEFVELDPADAGVLGRHDPAAETEARTRSRTEAVEGTITFSFSQRDGEPDMTLNARSAFPITLKYDAVMFVPAQDGMRPQDTSSCPIFSGISGIEHWPHPIGMIVLTNFRIQPQNRTVCE
jgi:hypothetical protein